MSKKRVKQYLMLLTVIGLVAIAAGGSGTFASFSAETTNPNNTFAAGTLYLHDSANGNTACTSESATTGPTFNVNPGTGGNGGACDALFTADLSQGATTAHLALSNAGSLASTDLKFDVPSCAWGKNNGASPVFISIPSDCSGVDITIQETGSSYTTPGSDVYCAYGPSTSQPDCNAPDNTATLANPTSFTSLLTAAGANATLSAGQTRYYVIKVDPTSVGTGNALQNLKLTFGLSWHMDH